MFYALHSRSVCEFIACFCLTDVISVYLDVNPGEVEPLLREIFDLKV